MTVTHLFYGLLSYDSKHYKAKNDFKTYEWRVKPIVVRTVVTACFSDRSIVICCICFMFCSLSRHEGVPSLSTLRRKNWYVSKDVCKLDEPMYIREISVTILINDNHFTDALYMNILYLQHVMISGKLPMSNCPVPQC